MFGALVSLRPQENRRAFYFADVDRAAGSVLAKTRDTPGQVEPPVPWITRNVLSVCVPRGQPKRSARVKRIGGGNTRVQV